MAQTVVIAGTGQGGFQVAASLRQDGFDGRIVMVGDEPGLPYQRPPLSKAYLKQDQTPEQVLLRKPPFYEKNDIEVIDGTQLSAIDRAGRTVTLGSGETLGYDHLVLAIGARNRTPPIPGAELDGVAALRTVAESEALRERLNAASHLMIVGAGFIGLEVAATARAAGLDVTVFEATPRVMGRAVTPFISRYFLEHHRATGIDIRLEAMVARILDDGGSVAGIETAAGERIEGDLALIAAGVVPNVELAAEAGLKVENGICVDDTLLTDDPAISAIGDCASFHSPFADGPVRFESVQNAVDQARCVAARLVGKPEPYASVPWFWSDQGALKLQMVGVTGGADRTVQVGSADEAKFSVFCYRGDRFLGAESVNRPGDHMACRRLMTEGIALPAETVAEEGFDLKTYVKAAVTN